MPLFDHLSSGAAHYFRLAKMTSCPTTEDLRYALEECKKKRKPVELPFEHPYSHQSFLVRVQLGQGTAPPQWTFLMGDGASAKVLWSRGSNEILTIQSKISMESSRTAEPAQANTGGGYGYANQSHQGLTAQHQSSAEQAIEPEVSHQQQSTSGGFQYSASENAFAQAPSFMGGAVASPQPITAPAPPTPAQGVSPPLQPAATPAVSRPAEAQAEASPAATGADKPAASQTPLPEPLKFDWTMDTNVQKALLDAATGLMSLGAFLFFLLRAWNRFQKNKTPFAVAVYEIAIQYPDGEIVALPKEALSPLSRRLQSACSPLDVMAHMNDGEFLVLIDSADGAAATEFCRGLYTILTETPLLPDANNQDLALISIGTASVAEIDTNPEVLVAAARRAKEMAKEAGSVFMQFPS